MNEAFRFCLETVALLSQAQMEADLLQNAAVSCFFYML